MMQFSTNIDAAAPHKRRAAALTAALAKRARRGAPPPAASDAAELADLLMRRIAGGADGVEGEDLVAAVEREYSPAVVEILARFAAGLERMEVVEELEDGFFSGMGDAAVPGCGGGFGVVDEIEDQCIPGAEVAALAEESLIETDGEDTEDEEVPPAVVSGMEYNKETEIALSRIFDLGKAAAVVDPSIPPYAPYSGPSVVAMTGFGELGRFGNQVLQYAFLKVYQARYGIDEVQVPAWVGAGLFGLRDRPVQRALPAVVETKDAKANSTFTGEFIEYIKASNAGREVAEVEAVDLGEGVGEDVVLKNVDFWGWFQWHTSCYRGYKGLIQGVFKPVAEIETPMMKTFNRELRWKGGVRRTVVGLHLRLGDYQNISASSFGYCAPTSWYLDLLEKLWPTLENPVLFVASDDLDAVLRDFAAYSPVTADAAGIVLPAAAAGLKAGFFPDWWSLTQCDVLAISNSTFSFSACMMNTVPSARFFRAHYADRMVAIDPWDADPIVHRDMSGNGLTTTVDALKVVYNTQGTRGLVRNVLYELPYYGLRSAIMKAVLWKNARANQALLSLNDAGAAISA
jgi:Glycosyl transferase family 11